MIEVLLPCDIFNINVDELVVGMKFNDNLIIVDDNNPENGTIIGIFDDKHKIGIRCLIREELCG